MNKFPNIKQVNKRELDLKTPANRSHNSGSDDERIKAFVKFLARRAAVEDFRMYEDALAPPDKINGGN